MNYIRTTSSVEYSVTKLCKLDKKFNLFKRIIHLIKMITLVYILRIIFIKKPFVNKHGVFENEIRFINRGGYILYKERYFRLLRPRLMRLMSCDPTYKNFK